MSDSASGGRRSRRAPASASGSTPFSQSTSPFRPVTDSPQSLDTRVVAYIRDLIEAGSLAPGDRLPPERDLAAQLGVSRTVLREALHTLAAFGLVDLQHGRGVFITAGSTRATAERLTHAFSVNDSAQRLRDLFEIRRVLEGAAAEWAAERATDEQIAELRTIVHEADAIYAHEPLDVAAAGALDARFHATLAAASANRTLLQLMVALVDELGVSRGRSLSIPGRPQKSAQQHERLLDAIAAHDASAARRAMLQHLNDVERSILSLDLVSRAPSE